VLVTGYRNVIRTFHRDPDLGRLKLAYFVVALIYNFTESAVRTLNPVWIGLLLAAMAVPENSLSEGHRNHDDTDILAEPEVHENHLVGAKLRQVRA
jgi:hypothetical protein